MSGTADHKLIGSLLRSPWRIERSSVIAVESIHGSAELSGSLGALGVLGGDSRSRTYHGQLTGLQGIGRDEGAYRWITCDPSGTWLELVSRGASGKAAGWLVEEKVGVTAGIITLKRIWWRNVNRKGTHRKMQRKMTLEKTVGRRNKLKGEDDKKVMPYPWKAGNIISTIKRSAN